MILDGIVDPPPRGSLCAIFRVNGVTYACADPHIIDVLVTFPSPVRVRFEGSFSSGAKYGAQCMVQRLHDIIPMENEEEPRRTSRRTPGSSSTGNTRPRTEDESSMTMSSIEDDIQSVRIAPTPVPILDSLPRSAFNMWKDEPSPYLKPIVMPPKKLPQPVPISPVQISKPETKLDEGELNRLHNLLSGWRTYSNYIPSQINKTEYPFPCGGFVLRGEEKNEIRIYTRRLGWITRVEDAKHKNYPFAYFMALSSGDCKVWEFDMERPRSNISVTCDGKGVIHLTGNALGCRGLELNEKLYGDIAVDRWRLWNDQVGLMKCDRSVVRNLEKSWNPTCRPIEFDAESRDNGKTWIVTTMRPMKIQTAIEEDRLPKEAYFLDDLILLSNEQKYPVLEFFSENLGECVYAHVDTLICGEDDSEEEEVRWGAIITTEWSNDGETRKYVAILMASRKMWLKSTDMYPIANAMYVEKWHEPKQG